MSSINYFFEEFDLTGDDGEDSALNLPNLANNGQPGLIGQVVFDDTLSDPIIDNGKVRMPRNGGSSKLVEFGSGIASPISGVLVGMCFATGIGEIFARNGEVYFPLAECTSAVCAVSSVPGAIAGVQTDSSITYPYISAGVLYLPAGGGQAEMATFEGTTSAVTGTLRAAMFSNSVDEISAFSGVLYFPQAEHSPILGTRLGAVCAATCDSRFPEGGIYGGVIYFPVAEHNSAVAARPGAISGATSDPDFPEGGIYGGVIYFPQGGGQAIKGLVSVDGYSMSWSDLHAGAGGQTEVATISLRVGSNNYVPLSLYAGINSEGYLTFSLTS